MPPSIRSAAPLIVTAGLSPAWQTILQFGRLMPGEVNRATASWHGASGKVLNVAITLGHLGHSCRAVTPLGSAAAAAAVNEFEALGIDLAVVPTAAATRSCTTLLDRSTGATTEIVENAASLTPSELDAFLTAYVAALGGAAVVVLSGSLPEGTPHTFYHDLLAHTRCPAIIDARGPELLASLGRRPLLVKPNRHELARTVGHALDSDAALLEAMQDLQQRGAEWVLVTDGGRHGHVVGPGIRFRITPLTVAHVENPIGCGDSLAAGFAAATAAGCPPRDAIVHGWACAAANCLTLLPGRINPLDVTRFEDLVTMESMA